MPTTTFDPANVGSLAVQQNAAAMVNGWTFAITGETTLLPAAPHNSQAIAQTLSGKTINFQKLSGLKRTVGSAEIGNPNGIITKASSGILKFDDITLSWIRGATLADADPSQFFTWMWSTGKKVTGKFTKYHHGKAVRSIVITGLFPKDESMPEYNLTSEEKEEVSMVCSVDYWADTFEA